MKVIWCWRCKMDIPMLDEVEFGRISQLMQQGFTGIKKVREQSGVALNEVEPDLRTRKFLPALDEYERITGFRETNPIALHHHRISIYGPPCTRCGKVLRTPLASKCFECGMPAERTMKTTS